MLACVASFEYDSGPDGTTSRDDECAPLCTLLSKRGALLAGADPLEAILGPFLPLDMSPACARAVVFRVKVTLVCSPVLLLCEFSNCFNQQCKPTVITPCHRDGIQVLYLFPLSFSIAFG